MLAAAPAIAADPDAVARGGYLAGAAGCESCHTDRAHGGRPYAGGRALMTAFGIIATPNLTPDRASGIGRWSAADFTRAMRWGVAPDDSHYVPAFPFPFYNRLSERDLGDLKAFLDSLPAVSQPALMGAGSTALVARTRAAIAVVATMLPGPWQPDPRKDPAWNRGAYLVHSLGRCGDCHTPRTLFGAPESEGFLAGALSGSPAWKPEKVPNITPDRQSGIGDWTVDDIVRVLTDGTTPDFDEVRGSMAEIVRSTARLSEEDRQAIAVFLKSVPPVSSPERK